MLKYLSNLLIFSIFVFKIQKYINHEKDNDQSGKKELIRQLKEARSEAKQAKAELKKGGTNLVNGISDSGIPRHRDVGHYFANCLKKVYGEDPDFKDLSERVDKTKHWSLDKDLAPLKAPNQRAIQRFMNIFPWMDWADKIIDAYYRMTPKEKLFLGFVQKWKKRTISSQSNR